MANRNFQKSIYHMTPGLTKLQFSITIDVSGDPTASTLVGEGITSVAQTATGIYTVTLDDVYASLLGANINLLKTSDVNVRFQLRADNVATAATKTVVFACYGLSSPAYLHALASCTMYGELILDNLSAV